MVSSNLDSNVHFEHPIDQSGWSMVLRSKNIELRRFFSDEQLAGTGIILGRGENCDLIIDEKSLSRTHCRILCSKGKLQIVDMESKNGIFINAQRIKSGEYVKFTNNDQLRLGNNTEAVEILTERVLLANSDGTMLVDDDEDESDRHQALNVTPHIAHHEVGHDAFVGGALADDQKVSPYDMQATIPSIIHLNAPRVTPTKTFPIFLTLILVVIAIGSGLWEYVSNHYPEVERSAIVASVPSTVESTLPVIDQLAVAPSAPVSVSIPQEISISKLKLTVAQVDPTPVSSKIRELVPRKKMRSNVTNKQYANINFGKFFALVIGNNDYQYISKLDNAIKDAEVVADTLVNNYLFNTTLILNGTRSDILATLDRMRAKLTEADNLLIFFAGHGIYDIPSERGFWLPVDAQADTRANWISNADITDTLKALQAKHVLVVADSCYAGTMTRAVESELPSPNVIKRINNYRSRTVLASGGVEPVMDGGGKSQHSIFTSAFLDALNNNKEIMDGSVLFSQIRDPVRMNTEQMPTYADIRNANHEVGGDFLFVRNNQ